LANKNIRDAFDAFTPSLEQKERIQERLSNRETIQVKVKKRLCIRKPLVVACSILLVISLGFGIFPILQLSNNGETNIELTGLTITAYAMGNDEPIPTVLKEGMQVEMALMPVPPKNDKLGYAFTLDFFKKFSYIRLQANTNEQDEAAWTVPEGYDTAYLVSDNGEPTWGENTIYWYPDNSVTELAITAYDDKRDARAIITLQVKPVGESFTVEIAKVKSYPVLQEN
jgi:hypothetical protein